MEPTILDRLLGISALFQRDTARSFDGTSLTETRVHALWVLQNEGAATQQTLAAALSVTPRSVSALIDALESTGYVERQPHPDDRRAVLVVLTEQAATMMARMQRDHAALTTELLSAVDEADRAAFERGVNAVYERLADLVDGEPVTYIDLEARPEERREVG
ncbi:MarR family winged helix-turn-helix transcriptional regulator [Microbacterium sp. MPKO10]|uniref:MarR family winged helix-turn-helix transcriptional regulator n=1 Tax=Microbacterium sp. MPKO10 TaxID=2989818 RepID=UPI002235804D|nr:MarR family transcriptional regulator [Microbacterium sp. MPKO10]MCW4456798.1 MarR family transcriptional regulator [Microbacterium sp. MPKO10]